MIHYHAPKKAFHKEHDDIQWSLRYLGKNYHSQILRTTTGRRLNQEYANLDVAQAMHEMRKNRA
jgi:hypothetical protein